MATHRAGGRGRGAVADRRSSPRVSACARRVLNRRNRANTGIFVWNIKERKIARAVANASQSDEIAKPDCKRCAKLYRLHDCTENGPLRCTNTHPEGGSN